MFTFWGLVAAVTLVGGGPIVAGLWTWHRSRSLRRNRHGQCAACGTAWESICSAEPYLIHGRLVCETCAAAARRRMPWHLGVLGVAAALATVLSAAAASSALMVLLPVGSTVVMTASAIQIMKRANRKAHRQIETNRYPEIHTLKHTSAS